MSVKQNAQVGEGGSDGVLSRAFCISSWLRGAFFFVLGGKNP